MRKLLFLLVIAGLGYWGWRQSHRLTQTFEDGTVAAQILAQIGKSSPLSLLAMKVSVDHGNVDLKGHVRTLKDEDAILEIVKGVKGVTGIKDHLMLDKRLRNREEFENDLKIMALIKKNLIQEEGLRGLQIHVDVEQGRVVLTGEVPAKEQALLAEKIAVSVKGVNEVHSHIITK